MQLVSVFVLARLLSLDGAGQVTPRLAARVAGCDFSQEHRHDPIQSRHQRT